MSSSTMITRIVHVSDFHFPSRDPGVAQVLADCIVDRLPHIIVVTGDIANHPSWLSPLGWGHWVAVRQWLADVKSRVEERSRPPERKTTILILSGNHDVLVSGLTGWCWPHRLLFHRLFAEWCGPLVQYDSGANLTFLTLDTNPRWALCSAEGKALGRRLKRLRRALDEHADAARIRSSTKILLMHHHPLPVPFQGNDWLLHTRRVDRLLQFLAENKVDLVLHGHKHRATWSHLRVGGTSYEPFFIETVGAGSAMKRDDYDPRGHNFNVIDLAPGGARRVRQFFKPPAVDRFSEVEASPAEELVSRVIGAHFRQPYSVQCLTWRVDADQEGDGRNELAYSGVVFNRAADAYEILLPEDDLVGGQALPYHSLRVTPADFPGRLAHRDLDQEARTFVVLDKRPMEKSALEFTVANYTLNAYSMDRREGAERGQADPDRDGLDFLLMEAVDELRLEATFPDEFRFEAVRVEVLEPLEVIDVVHEDLTNKFHGSARAVGGHFEVKLQQPPPNCRYRVTWALPAPQVAPISSEGNARRAYFEKALLTLVASPQPKPGSVPYEVLEAIIEAFEDISSALEELVCQRNALAKGAAVVDETTDLSVMVCDRSVGLPQLRLIFWNKAEEHGDAFQSFRLVIGNGNAGRAYKTRALRLFDKEQSGSDPKASAYVQLRGVEHRFMFSIPMIDPLSQSPLAVFNVGTADPTQAAAYRSLNKSDLQRLIKALHGRPLARLAEAIGLRLESSTRNSMRGSENDGPGP
jgi:hypothetical protein